MGLNVVYMSSYEGYRFLIVVYCDLSSWVEAKLLHTLSSQAVANFLWEDIICKYGCFGKLIIVGRSKNKDVVVELAQRYGIKRVVISAYYPQANRMIKRGHKPIINAFSQMSDRGSTNWV